MAEGRGRILGIGGIFLKSADPQRLGAWYAAQLGLPVEGDWAEFPWLSKAAPGREHRTVWALFPEFSEYFEGAAMISYVVDELDALLAKLEARGVRIDPKREEYDYGRFAWVYDPEGNKIELWEPRG
jgi:predicted enzyme related to lactoylglutathione lyase